MKKSNYFLFYLCDLSVRCGYYIIINELTTSPKIYFVMVQYKISGLYRIIFSNNLNKFMNNPGKY